MRLAVIWAKENGASEETVMQLAQATDLNDTSNPAIQLAFDFIGDKTITELYREHKLIAPTPLAIGGDTTKRDADGNAIKPSKEEILAERAKVLETLARGFVKSCDNWTAERLVRLHPIDRKTMLLAVETLRESLKAVNSK